VTLGRLHLSLSLPVFMAAVCAMVLLATTAMAFNYALYQPTNLDDLLSGKRPASGADFYDDIPMKLTVTLSAYSEPCETDLLNKSLELAHVTLPDNVKVTQCIQVRSAGGRQVRMFIQDQVAAFLPKEVPLGGKVTLFAVHLFTSAPDGPGLMVNEFDASKPNAN